MSIIKRIYGPFTCSEDDIRKNLTVRVKKDMDFPKLKKITVTPKIIDVCDLMGKVSIETWLEYRQLFGGF